MCAGKGCNRRARNGQCADELSTNCFRNDDVTQEQTKIPRKSPDLAFSDRFVAGFPVEPVQLIRLQRPMSELSSGVSSGKVNVLPSVVTAVYHVSEVPLLLGNH